MKRIISPQCFLLPIILFLLFSCQKKIESISSIKSGPVKTTDGIPAYYFQWQSADVMPVPANYAGPTIFTPWSNGAVTGFSSDIRYDMQPIDGWNLVYNEFDPTKTNLPANPFFMLYNKYRGLLRIYVYVTNSGFQNSTYLTSGLNLGPNTISSSMLNYIGQDIVNLAQPQTIVSKVEPTQIASNTWYASQFEICYDPNIAATTYQQLGYNFTLKWTNIDSVSLGGTEQGTLNGSITTPASSGFNLSGLASGALEATGLAIFSNNKGSAQDFSQNTLGLPGNIFGAVQSGLSDGLKGVVKDLFSGLFGGSSGGSTQQVNLTLNANITLKGNISGGGALIPDPGLTLGVSGTSNSQSAPGLIPYYNQPMGIVNLSAQPTVTETHHQVRVGTNRSNMHYVCSTVFSINNNSFSVLYNPAVINSSADGAQIQNFKQEIVWIDNNEIGYDGLPVVVTGWPETIGNLNVHTSPTNQISGSVNELGPANVPGAKIAVRISFYVVPNSNPAAKVFCVKTFYTNQRV